MVPGNSKRKHSNLSVGVRRGHRHNRVRSYRIRLIAYDAIPLSFWRLPLRMPSPSPTPLVLLARKRTYYPRKIHLVRLGATTDIHRSLLDNRSIL